jgi:1-deoxy-D-xylulose-5-phosphate synthase
MVLDKINAPNDIRKLSKEELNRLPKEIRRFLIEHLSVTGGHLASNLGCVELTMALHMVMDFPKDKLIWDVSHQSYTHKILTGRKDGFEHLRQYGGMSGFTNPGESDCDVMTCGHASTSLSAGLGLAYARQLKGEDYKVVSVIGDGSLTGGLALEGLNNAALLKSNFTIILNDNNMSISPNVGGMSMQLANLRTSRGYNDLKDDIIEEMIF